MGDSLSAAASVTRFMVGDENTTNLQSLCAVAHHHKSIIRGFNYFAVFYFISADWRFYSDCGKCGGTCSIQCNVLL